MLRRLPFVVVLAVSLYAFFVPADHVPTDVPTSDKVVHAALFAALLLAGRVAGFRVWPLAAALAAYGALTEVLQATLPINRDGDVRDLLADVVGIGVALLLVLVPRRRGPAAGRGAGAPRGRAPRDSPVRTRRARR